MDTRSRIVRQLGLVLVALQLNLGLTLAQWNATVTMQPFPSPYLGDWESNPTIGSLMIANNTSSPADVLVYLTLSRNSSGVIATGHSNPIATSPGVPTQVNSDRFIDWGTVTYNQSMRDQAVQTGRLPEGEYTACVTVKDLSGSVLVADACAPFTIVYPDPPSLFFPADGDSLTSPYPTFTWTPVQVPPAYQLHYILRICEILPGQTPHQALLANVVQYEDDNLLTTNLQYPLSALSFEAGKIYAWQVQAVDQNGFPPSANDGRSEIWTFVAKEVTSQTPPPTASTSPLQIKLVPASPGGPATFSSFSDVVHQMEGGSIVIPYGTDSLGGQQPDTITVLAQNGWYADSAKRSWAAKGRLWGTGTSNSSSEVLVAGVWGPALDVTRTILAWKTRIAGFKGFAVLSGREFDLKPDDLPGELAGGTSSSGDTTFVTEAFAGTEGLDLKRGLNLLGRFDLSSTNNGSHPIWTALGVDDPYIKVSGTLSPKLGVGFSLQKVAGQDLEHEAEGERGWEAELSGEIPVARAPIKWLPELNLEAAISLEKDTPKNELKVDFKLGGVGKVTAPWFSTLHLNDTIEVKVGGKTEWTRDSTGFQSGWPDFIVYLEFDDVVKFDKFENVFKVHDPKFEWNITKWRKNEGGLKFEAEFDIAQIEKVGTIEIELEKKPDSTNTSSTASGWRRQAGVWSAMNPDTSGSQSSSGTPALPPKVNLAAMMNKEQPQPLSGGEPPRKWAPKVTAKFDPIALGSLSLSLLLRTCDLIADAGNVDELNPSTRNSAPAPSYPPPELPDFLSSLPRLSELAISFRPGSLGSMVMTGKTTYNNSSTEIIIARAESPTKKGFILGLKPQNWSIRNYFPDFSMPGLDNVTLSNVTLVFSNVEGNMPSSELTDEEFKFYSSVYGSNDFTVVLKDGLNLIATIPSEGLTINSPLLPLMNKLGVQQGNVLLQGSLGKKVKDIYLLAVFPSMHPEGSPAWFNSGEIGIELTGQPSVGLAAALSVNIKGEVRNFLVKTKAGREGLLLVGGMIADSGWVSPFGIQGLTLNEVVLLLGLTPAGSVQLGFEGDLVVGEKDMHTAVLVALNAATGVPTNFMFDGESEAGFGVSDLVKLQEKMAAARSAGSPAIPLNNIPPLYIQDAKLKFAPKDSPELGISRGMTVKGLLELKPASGSSTKELASVLFDVGGDGLVARGNIPPFTVGPVKLQDASMDLTLTRSDQHFTLDGKTDLGFMNGDIAMKLTKTSALFHAETKIFNAFQADLDGKGELNLKKPAFLVHATMKNDFSGALARDIRQAVKDIVARRKDEATAAANAVDQELQAAINAREAAQRHWAAMPVLPRNPKVTARNAWERAVAKAVSLRVQKEAKEGKMRRWTLAQRFLDHVEQQQGNKMIVIRGAEFDADLAKLKTGAVQKMEISMTIGDRQFDLNLAGWNFKNMGESVKVAAQHATDKLFASFQ